ncbi:MAG: rhodanese-like domain-containing protein [Candidatus Xenobia bacterium]
MKLLLMALMLLTMTAEQVPRITAHQLYAEWKQHQVLVVDVRSEKAFAVCHIPGAINMTRYMLEKAKKFPRDREIVLYCA